ncbi:MAG: FHA domain-containing protein [Candidatus Eremiobacteraeota bacterium]|nr:FHA domain-containing protein [Candidatus Eremiobacteraeota bacterium]
MEGSIYCEDCGAPLPVASGSPAAAPAPIAAPPAAAPAPAPAPAPMPADNTPAAAEPTREEMPAVPSSGDGSTTCTTCGASNPAGETYCEDCGAALPGASAQTPIPAATIADTPPPITPTPAVVPSTPQEAVAAAASGRPRLESTETGQTFILSKDENLVGRRSPVDGIFPEVDLTEADKDSYISRRHGKIIMGEQGAVYEDLGSSNGSFHNGSRLQQGVQAKLSEGDNLRLGRTELVYHTN